MKILHVVPTYLPATRYGGPIYSVHGLCSALANHEHSVSVYTTSVDGDADSDVEHNRSYNRDGVEVVYFKSSRLRRIYYSPSLKDTLSQSLKNFDLLHLHSIFLYPTNIAARIAKRNNIPYVLSPRGMLEKSLINSKSKLVKNCWLTLIEKKTIENSSLIHVTSDRELQELEKFRYSLPQVVVIPNGVDNAIAPTEVKFRDNSVFQILFLGRINWKKQIGQIITALQYIDFEVKFIIAGNDEEGHKVTLEHLIDELNLGSYKNIQIQFFGEVDAVQKRELYLNSNAMLLTSISENFGNTVIEAMALGCPVIVTPQVGASEIVKKVNAGLLTDGTPRSIASCIAQIRNNPAEATKMSMNGIKEIRENYLWKNIAGQMVQTYRSVISSYA